ncbi:MAG: DNA-directed RNA polymerase subunit omega [Defluviitaleaceae bacterium]|nr:DNA-directed RNA polymerase subunit omega [Defluviitaleaceae bacterium]MCL2264215.1 DNA-directed RNA polymerase subunit omega [Defluviitaleaceae bacterium]
MLTPSYSQLMDVIKQNERLDSRVTSRYTVVLAAAKRARQLTDGANPLTYAPTDRAVSIAVKEMNEGKLRLRVQENLLTEDIERVIRDRQHYRTALSKDDLNENLKQDYAPVAYGMDDSDEVFPAFEKEEPVVEAVAKEEEEDFTLYEDSDEEPQFKEESAGE